MAPGPASCRWAASQSLGCPEEPMLYVQIARAPDPLRVRAVLLLIHHLATPCGLCASGGLMPRATMRLDRTPCYHEDIYPKGTTRWQTPPTKGRVSRDDEKGFKSHLKLGSVKVTERKAKPCQHRMPSQAASWLEESLRSFRLAWCRDYFHATVPS